VNYEVTGTQTLPNTSMPTIGSRYIRQPFQPGEKGMTISGDAYLGGVSGLGGGAADLTQRGNLSTSAWAPVGNSTWPATDPNTLTFIGGPSGVKIQDASGATVITLTGSAISMSTGGHTLVINSSGVVIDGKIFLLHEHTLVQTGASDSGPVA
jgi:hypothetical protein